jgi:hypothetical protein
MSVDSSSVSAADYHGSLLTPNKYFVIRHNSVLNRITNCVNLGTRSKDLTVIIQIKYKMLVNIASQLYSAKGIFGLYHVNNPVLMVYSMIVLTTEYVLRRPTISMRTKCMSIACNYLRLSSHLFLYKK